MEYVQERVATLHDLTGVVPEAPTDRATVVVPMTEREYGGLAAERVLSELARVDPPRLVVPLRAPADRVADFESWVTGTDVPTTVLWCNGPRVEDLLDDHGLDGERGKGRDVWLALGQALADDAEYVAVHDADTSSYDRSYVHRLLFPLAHGFDFSKGYYARVENDRLYGRLFRLLVAPAIRALANTHDAPVLDYLASFRYALAGEFAATLPLVRRLRVHPSWGLELGTLGDAFAYAGLEGSAQVDLGTYEHDHRAVGGPTGLSEMSRSVARALFRVVEEHGVDPDYEALPGRYREVARSYVRGYAVDAAFNRLSYDRADELSQVDVYADAVVPPGEDDRLPAWRSAPISPDQVREAAEADLADVRGGERD
jgi:glucosyl-3-phosphoglycerate synthase